MEGETTNNTENTEKNWQDVAYFVQLGWLTGQDFKDITGDDYVAPTNS